MSDRNPTPPHRRTPPINAASAGTCRPEFTPTLKTSDHDAFASRPGIPTVPRTTPAAWLRVRAGRARGP